VVFFPGGFCPKPLCHIKHGSLASLYAIGDIAYFPHSATFFLLATLSGKPIFANRCQQNCQQNIDFVDSK